MLLQTSLKWGFC